MTQRTSVPSRPPSALELSPVVSSSVALSPVGPSSPLILPPDVVRLLEVLARIELRRQLRLRALTTQEVS
jgi:hypothetical protein